MLDALLQVEVVCQDLVLKSPFAAYLGQERKYELPDLIIPDTMDDVVKHQDGILYPLVLVCYSFSWWWS